VTTLVLASASAARLATLRAAGIEPRVVVSGVDEDALLAAAGGGDEAPGPADTALLLARAKAEAVHVDDAIVLGGDSVLELDGRAYGKPADAAEARRRWRAMSGRTGVLHTGHWLVDRRDPSSNGSVGVVGSTVVHFADLTGEEIDAYVATGEPLEVAGAFKIDGLGGPFIRAIEGDHHNVVGLSLPLVRTLLGRLGVPWHSLWRVRQPS
jgi:septum formation protein